VASTTRPSLPGLRSTATRLTCARRRRLEVYGSFDAVTFNFGIMPECLGGIETGQRELLEWIDP